MVPHPQGLCFLAASSRASFLSSRSGGGVDILLDLGLFQRDLRHSEQILALWSLIPSSNLPTTTPYHCSFILFKTSVSAKQLSPPTKVLGWHQHVPAITWGLQGGLQEEEMSAGQADHGLPVCRGRAERRVDPWHAWEVCSCMVMNAQSQWCMNMLVLHPGLPKSQGTTFPTFINFLPLTDPLWTS